MKPIALLASMLMLSAVIGRGNGNFAEEQAEKEPPIDDKAQHVSKRETVVCGDTKIVLTNVKREDSRFNDTEISDVYDDEPPGLDKILGGSYATYGEIPWMATILYNEAQVCGGSIISEFWVISAAHCFYGFNASRYKVAVGDHRLWYRDPQEETYNVAQIINHEEFHKRQFKYDIALMKIKPTVDGRGIQFNNHVQPICLPDSTDIPPVGTRMTFSGWGWSSKDSGRSELLKRTILPVLTYATCKRTYPYVMKPNMFCAGYILGDTEACGGDSGGPATHKSGGNYKLYGIVVFNNRCGRPNFPNGFVSVPAYRNWIDTNIRQNGQGSETVMPKPRLTVTL